ncbi:MAG: C69 family dipeptidase [Bacteroidales bacterium]|nr:C69 family dipeptidase [Bacteroidales bacterium]MDD4669417.1 C69 family dipeptidase [Bacteroidales bacterium]
MTKLIKILICTAASLFIWNTASEACTNVIVTKGASKDGSCMVTYAADSHQLYGELYFHPAKNWPAGSMIDIYEWDTGKYLGQISQVAHTYKTVGNMNEHQLIIAETTFGGREELANPNGIMDYGSLIYTTLQRAKTAREAILIMDALMQQYGFPSAGESFSVADKNECWIMEIVGKGKELGSVWVAVKIPDGYISGHANQSRIDKFPLNDPDNCLYAKDVISFARKSGYFKGEDKDFSFCDTYAPADWSALRGCEARVWSAFRILGKENFDSDKYLDYAMGENAANKMPLYIKPAEKVGVKDLADVMRDHYEGTPMDFSEDVGAGPNKLPYRWRPMGFKVDGVSYGFERSIATQQTGFWFVAQSRNWLPDEIGGILWFGVDDAATSAVTPIYTNITSIPECFRVGNGNMMEYSETSAFWLFNKVTHFAYLLYDRVQPVLRAEIDKYENENIALVAEIDAKALKMLNGGNRNQAIAYLTEFDAERSAYLCNKWKELERFLLVKFMDGNIKHQNPDGTFKDNGSGKNIPASPAHPAHRDRWVKGIVIDHGETIKTK